MEKTKKGEKRGMKKEAVFICSPYRAADEKELAENVALAKRVCRYALDTGSVPYAPHLFFPQFVSEKDERQKGMEAGLEMLQRMDELWVVGNRISEGMAQEITLASQKGIPVMTVVDPLVAEEHLLDAVFGGKDYEDE